MTAEMVRTRDILERARQILLEADPPSPADTGFGCCLSGRSATRCEPPTFHLLRHSEHGRRLPVTEA